MEDTRFWLYDSERLSGPYTAHEIELAAPSESALVCDEANPGMRKEDWKPAREVLGGEGAAPPSLETASTAVLLAEVGPIEPGPPWLAGIGDFALEAYPETQAAMGGSEFIYSEILFDDLMPPFLGAGLFLEGMVPEAARVEPPPPAPVATQEAGQTPAGPAQERAFIRPFLGPPAAPVVPAPPPLSALGLAQAPGFAPAAPVGGGLPPFVPASLPPVAPAAREGDFLSGFKLEPPKTFKLAEEPAESPSEALPADAGSPPQAHPAAQASEPAAPEASSPTPSPAQETPAFLEGVPPPQAEQPPPAEVAALEAPAPQEASGLEAVLEPAFFSQEPQRQALEPEGTGAQSAEVLAGPPLGGGGPSGPAALAPEGAAPLAEGAPGGAPSAPAGETGGMTIGATTQEVISKLAKPPSEPTKDAKQKKQKKKSLMAPIGLAASILILILAWYLFMDRGGPPQTAPQGEEAAGQNPQAANPNDQSQEPLPQAAPQQQISEAPPPQEDQQAPSQQPLPASPLPPQQMAQAQPPSAPKDDAVAMVLDYPLDGGRKSIGAWLSKSLQTPRYEQEWSAGPLGEGSYLVQDQVSDTEESTSMVYLFEADLNRHTVKADNAAARSLWKPADAQ